MILDTFTSGMIRFIITRLISGFAMLLVLLLICLWMIRLIPGSYNDLIQGEEYQIQHNPIEQLERIPLFYFTIIPEATSSQNLFSLIPDFKWYGLQNEFHQNLKLYTSFRFGNSLADGVEVKKKFLKALPWSLILQIPAILIIILCSVFFAFKRIQFPNSKFLKCIDSSLIWIHSIPGFWLATMLLLLFANPDMLQWLPSGMQSVSSQHPFTLWLYYPHYLILPLVCLVIPALAYLVRLIKNGLEDSLQKMYWKRALSSGLSFQQALYKEALPMALIPLIAWFAGVFPALISGSLIIEYIFSIPGLGRLMYLSISMRDWPMVQFLFLLGSSLTILGFLISDILLRYFDPRIRTDK